MRKTSKLLSGMWKNVETGPFHNSRNIYPYIFDTTYLTDRRRLWLRTAMVVGAGLSLFGFVRTFVTNHENKFALGNDWESAAKAKQLSMGWWQEKYWKTGDAIYLPLSRDSDWEDDNSPADWPVDRALAHLDNDEWWEKFESTRPRGWVNVLPEVFNVFKIKKNSMEGAEDEEDEDAAGDEEEGEGEAERSFFVLPYNFYNPTSALPSGRSEYRRVMEIVNEGLPRKSDPVPDLYRNEMAGCTAIIDPDGPRPVKVTFSSDWRDLSPQLLSNLRERLIWKYKDDFENYAPPQLAQQLKDSWHEYVQVKQN